MLCCTVCAILVTGRTSAPLSFCDDANATATSIQDNYQTVQLREPRRTFRIVPLFHDVVFQFVNMSSNNLRTSFCVLCLLCLLGRSKVAHPTPVTLLSARNSAQYIERSIFLLKIFSSFPCFFRCRSYTISSDNRQCHSSASIKATSRTRCSCCLVN